MALTTCSTVTNQSGMEVNRHGTGLFPIACYHDDLSAAPVPWHWHTELEIGIVTAGSAVIAAGAERFTAKQGDGFFVNSGVLHGMWSCGSFECRFHSAVFHPRLVGGNIDSIFWQNYIHPLISDGTRQSIHFEPSIPWHKESLCAIESAWESCVEEPLGYDLQVREALSRFTFLLSRNRPGAGKAPSEKAIRNEQRMKEMLRFIQENYADELNTAAIAGSAMISESECLRCFRNTIGTAPIQYLKQFRIQKAAELLLTSEEGMAEIGAQCGFQDASYFSKTFRALKGSSPSEYRKEKRAISPLVRTERHPEKEALKDNEPYIGAGIESD